MSEKVPDNILETYEQVGNKVGLVGLRLEKYIKYMKTRWGKQEYIQCVTGYAQEWAERFFTGREYQASDSDGLRVLKTIDDTTAQEVLEHKLMTKVEWELLNSPSASYQCSTKYDRTPKNFTEALEFIESKGLMSEWLLYGKKPSPKPEPKCQCPHPAVAISNPYFCLKCKKDIEKNPEPSPVGDKLEDIIRDSDFWKKCNQTSHYIIDNMTRDLVDKIKSYEKRKIEFELRKELILSGYDDKGGSMDYSDVDIIIGRCLKVLGITKALGLER